MLWHLFVKGGPAMYLLFLCSIWGLYLVIYKFIYLRVNHSKMAAIVTKVKGQLARIGREETIEHLSGQKGIVNRVLHDTLQTAAQHRGEAQEPTEITHHELLNLERNLNILSTIITIAPMLGLFGTILGLIRIFNVVSGGSFGDPSVLAGGIAEALITTTCGLLVAILLMFPYQLLAHKTDVFILDLQNAMNDVLEFSKRKKE